MTFPGEVYVGAMCGFLLAFLVACSVGVHRDEDWVTEDLVMPVLFAILAWPLALVIASLYFGGRAAHAGIGYLVRPRAPVIRDAEQAAAEQEVERLLKERS